MRRIGFGLLIALALAATAGIWAQVSETEKERLRALRPDPEILKAMSREERRAARQAYKAARLAALEAAGGPARLGWQPLETPIQLPKATARNPGSNITYDTGVVSGTFNRPGQTVGNRFDSALHTNGVDCCFPVESSGSITRITFHMVNTFSNSAVWTLYSNIMGNSAVLVTDASRMVTPGLNTLSVMSPTTVNAYMGGSFLAGIWHLTAMSTAVGIDDASTGSQGFHAIVIDDTTGGMGINMAPILTAMGAGRNVIFRVSGNVATPVELMHFEIEDD